MILVMDTERLPLPLFLFKKDSTTCWMYCLLFNAWWNVVISVHGKKTGVIFRVKVLHLTWWLISIIKNVTWDTEAT